MWKRKNKSNCYINLSIPTLWKEHIKILYFEIILGLKKSCKNSLKNSSTHFTCILQMFTSDITVVELPKLRN